MATHAGAVSSIVVDALQQQRHPGAKGYKRSEDDWIVLTDELYEST